MIRLALIEDIPHIETIGLQISKEFCQKYNIIEELKKDYTEIYVYEEENDIKGFIHIEKHYEITDIINIAVKENYQGNGIGKMLINYIMKNMTSQKILLEVRESNIKAIRLYNRCGFTEINRRRKYYLDEDAIIMERSIKK